MHQARIVVDSLKSLLLEHRLSERIPRLAISAIGKCLLHIVKQMNAVQIAGRHSLVYFPLSIEGKRVNNEESRHSAPLY